MKKYVEYKEISLPWLKEIPSHWEVKRNKNVFKEMKAEVGENHANYTLLSLTLNGIIPRNMNGGGKFPTSFDKYKIVKPGDMAFCLFDIDETPRTVGLSNYDGMLTGAYTIMEVKNIERRYVYYYYLSLDNVKALKPLYSGLRKTINTDLFQSTKLPVPPRPEQDQIVRFLDWKVSGINKLINIKKKEIKELEELKKVIINKAVTRGLDENVELKDSGVNWIGMIPVNWDLVKIKRVTKQRNQKGLFEKDNSKYIGLENISGYDSELIDTQSEYDTSVQSMCFKGDVMFSKLRPYLSKVIISPIDAFCTGELLILSDFSGNKEYLRYVMLHQSFIQEITASTYGAKMPRANADFILNQIIPLPKLSEQDKIVEYLNNKIKEIDGMADMIANEVATLHDLKSTLISDVVTGQIDVRDVEIPEYVFEDESSDLSEDDFEAEVTEEED